MTVRIVAQSRELTAPVEKHSPIEVVRSYRGIDIAEFPMSVTVYRNATQSIPASAWTAVPFNVAQFPNASYNVPILWTTGTDVTLKEDGWYWLGASVGLAAQTGTDIIQSFRFMFGGSQISGAKITVPAAYTFTFSGSVVYWFAAATVITLQVYHNYSAALNLRAGITTSRLSIMRISS